MRRALLILVACGLAVFALWWLLVGRLNRPTPPITHPATLGEVAPARAQAAIRSAPDVEAVLTVSHQTSSYPRTLVSRDSTISMYAIRSAPVRLAEAQRAELRALLLDRLNYQNERPPCIFMPNVAYRFLAPAETLDVLVCHGCDEVHFVETDTTGTGGCAIPIGDRLMALTRSLFPRDSVIAAQVREDARNDSIDAERARRRRR